MNDKLGYFIYVIGGMLMIFVLTPYNYFFNNSTLLTFFTLSVGVIFVSVAWREFRILKQENKI